MSATLHYGIKEIMSDLSQKGRWNVLTVLILHANIRNRCWVSINTLTKLAANGDRNKASNAKRWLKEHKAFTLVPYEKRVDEEKHLHPRQHIYQLTGVLEINGKVYPYLYTADFNSTAEGTNESTVEHTIKSTTEGTGSIPNRSKTNRSISAGAEPQESVERAKQDNSLVSGKDSFDFMQENAELYDCVTRKYLGYNQRKVDEWTDEQRKSAKDITQCFIDATLTAEDVEPFVAGYRDKMPFGYSLPGAVKLPGHLQEYIAAKDAKPAPKPYKRKDPALTFSRSE